MKRLIFVFMSLIFVMCLSSCNDENRDDLEWNNDEAIYVNINKEFKTEVLNNLSTEFKEYNYKKIYVTQKEIYDDGSIDYQLLFIINSSLEEFINKLESDERIASFQLCKDLPFESYDYRKMRYDKETIKVGESLTISLEGKCKFYYQPFDFRALSVKLKDYNRNKEYSKADFPELNNIDYITQTHDKILIVFKNENYYELIKAMDLLSRSENIQGVNFIYLHVIHPIWEVSDEEIVNYVVNSDNTLTITALKPGTVKIQYDGLECFISVTIK